MKTVRAQNFCHGQEYQREERQEYEFQQEYYAFYGLRVQGTHSGLCVR